MGLKSIDTIYIKRKLGSNEFGESSFDAEETFLGRWDDANNEVYRHNGENIVSNGVIYTDQSVANQPKIGDAVRLANDTISKVIVGNRIDRNGAGTTFLYSYFLGV